LSYNRHIIFICVIIIVIRFEISSRICTMIHEFIFKIFTVKIKKVDYNIQNQRFDRYLRKYFKPYPEIKLNDIFSRIRKWAILVNGKRVDGDYRLRLGDEIKFTNIETWDKKPTKLADTRQQKFKDLNVSNIKKMIIYEDENWLVFDKPAWIVAHPSDKHKNDLCMNDYLEKYCGTWDDTFKPSFCYRLDKDTSWILIWAKNYQALQYLNELIRDRKTSKEYHCVVLGKAPDHLIIDKKIEKFFSKKFGSSHMSISENWLDAKTEIWNEKTVNHPTFWEISLVRVKLYTGRMHQIRVHLASESLPVLWDIIYGNPAANRKMYKVLKINRQMLHCSMYSFQNLDGKEIKFSAPMPKDFDKLMGW